MLASWAPIRNSVQQQDFPGMLSEGYFHPFSSRVAASVVGIDKDREGQRSGYQLPPVAGLNSIKILLNCNAYYPLSSVSNSKTNQFI
jgi:hypothetical protein